MAMMFWLIILIKDPMMTRFRISFKEKKILFIMLCSLMRFQWPLEVKQAHSITEPPPYLTVGTHFFVFCSTQSVCHIKAQSVNWLPSPKNNWPELVKQRLLLTVKFSGGPLMLWGCFSSKGFENLARLLFIINSLKHQENICVLSVTLVFQFISL